MFRLEKIAQESIIFKEEKSKKQNREIIHPDDVLYSKIRQKSTKVSNLISDIAEVVLDYIKEKKIEEKNIKMN